MLPKNFLHKPPYRCHVPTCPLNVEKIPHNLGLYQHHDLPPTNPAPLFGASNPPPFIWAADEARKEAMMKIGNGENVAENRRIAEECAELVGRFLDLHLL